MKHFDHNAHHHRFLLRQVPVGARTALDVGCGTGAFARELAARGLAVTAVDRWAGTPVPARESGAGESWARESWARESRLAESGLAESGPGESAGVEFRRADALVDDLGGPYDFVSCVAALHHMPLVPALVRLRSLVRPGGVVAVLGLAREEGAADRALSLASVPLNFAVRLVRDDPRPEAPVADPSSSLREVMAEADRVLPGARFRRHLYWRYSMIWTAGAENSPTP